MYNGDHTPLVQKVHDFMVAILPLDLLILNIDYFQASTDKVDFKQFYMQLSQIMETNHRMSLNVIFLSPFCTSMLRLMWLNFLA